MKRINDERIRDAINRQNEQGHAYAVATILLLPEDARRRYQFRLLRQATMLQPTDEEMNEWRGKMRRLTKAQRRCIFRIVDDLEYRDDWPPAPVQYLELVGCRTSWDTSWKYQRLFVETLQMYKRLAHRRHMSILRQVLGEHDVTEDMEVDDEPEELEGLEEIALPFRPRMRRRHVKLHEIMTPELRAMLQELTPLQHEAIARIIEAGHYAQTPAIPGRMMKGRDRVCAAVTFYAPRTGWKRQPQFMDALALAKRLAWEYATTPVEDNNRI